MLGCCCSNALTRHPFAALASAPDVVCAAGTTRAQLICKGGTRWSTQVRAGQGKERQEAKRSAPVFCGEQGHKFIWALQVALLRVVCTPERSTLSHGTPEPLCATGQRHTSAKPAPLPRPSSPFLALPCPSLQLHRDQRDTLGLLAPCAPSLACARPPSLPHTCGGPPHDA